MALTESEQHAAELAVARYGADPARIDGLVEAVRAARAQGDHIDLLDLMEREQVLKAEQLGDLRFGLDKTHIDRRRSQNPDMAAVPEPQHNAAHDESLNDLRALGDYRILRRLGGGGMGSVFLAFHEKDQEQVAIKILSGELAKHQPTLDRFYREAKSGAVLNHPHIVRSLSAGQDRATGLHYLILEFVDGSSGQELLERFGKLSVGDAVHIVLDVARALEHAHSRNFVHRDIKPGNILIAKSGLAKLADLGLAKRTDEASHLTLTRQGFGTPYYMPYEQAMNARKADARSDIYALGATLYHLVTGEVPFPGTNSLEIVDKKGIGEFLPARTHNAGVSIELDRILGRMLAREPSDRYQTSSELIVDLERSNLGAAVPSFVDQADAYSDPLVRERLTAPAQATVLDVRVGDGSAPPFWYVLYKDSRGGVNKAKMTTELVRKRLQSGKLTPSAKAATSPKGPFAPLHAIAEFDEVAPPPVLRKSKKAAFRAAIQAASADADRSQRLWWLLSLGLVVVIVVVTAFTLVAWPE